MQVSWGTGGSLRCGYFYSRYLLYSLFSGVLLAAEHLKPTVAKASIGHAWTHVHDWLSGVLHILIKV